MADKVKTVVLGAREKVLYEKVEAWMRQKYHCFQSGTNLGFAYSRVDVLGVRDIGGSGSGEILPNALKLGTLKKVK